MNLPSAFIERISELLAAEAPYFFNALDNPAPVSVRLNPRKSAHVFLEAAEIPWCTQGRYLTQRPVFTLDPLFHAGVYYVQEASSMFLEQVFRANVDINKPLRVLDLCAAPGGKSTLLQSLLSENSLLVANELIPKRNQILCENLSKWGGANVIVTQNEASDFAALPEFFDVIVVDAPCSGEGLFRKDEDAVSHWSPAGVMTCASRQTDILDAVLPALKTGGILIYSTCTYEEDENEQVIQHLISHRQCSLQIASVEAPESVVRSEYGFRFYPHKVAGEGFFISCVRKEQPSIGEELFHGGAKRQLSFTDDKKVPDVLRQLVSADAPLAWFIFKSEYHCIPQELQRHAEHLGRILNVRMIGVCVGTEKAFHPTVALSLLLSITVPRIALNHEQALKYLKGESLHLDASKGWAVVTYQDIALGWVKAIPGRLNNHYPKEWRIRMSLG